MKAPLVNPKEQFILEQFYFQEARLLDGRQYEQWFGLLTNDFRFIMPSRTNPLVDNRMRGNERMIAIENELEDEASDGSPIREENYFQMMIRAERAYKINSWAENPPARTRRIIGNIEVVEREKSHWKVISNFHLHYSRPNTPSFMYSGQRRDMLIPLTDSQKGDSYMINHREVILDYGEIEYPTLGLFF